MSDLLIFLRKIVVTVIDLLTYKKTFHKKPIEEVNNLVSRYEFAKQLTNKVLGKLEGYAINNHAYDKQFMHGITFRKGINILLETKEHIFNAENDSLFSNPKEITTYGIQKENT